MNMNFNYMNYRRRLTASVILLLTHACIAATQFNRDFAALEGFVKPVEQPFRQEICLNGSWQFQPVPVPAGFERNRGIAPELPPPGNGWEATPIRIPSPWNVNTYGAGRDVGAGTPHPYWPDSVCFPSYPVVWDSVQMGWLRRSFRPPDNWQGKRVVLHFEAVAGACQVLVNGKLAGEHFDNFLPFELDVTALIRRGADNELLVGVRHPWLFDKTNPRHPHERATYAAGSNLDGIVGIWQDVYLLGVPTVRAKDVFVQPWVDQNELWVETTLRNDTDQPQEVTLAGDVRPWINEAGSDVLSAPEPKGRLGETVFEVPGQTIHLPANSDTIVTLKAKVGACLKMWSPDSPNLYGLVLTIRRNGQVEDTRYQRFGWRQFRIQGGDLLLNDRKFQVVADILHPFGVAMHSRRHAYAWYRMIKDAGGNGVRLHAQPWPAYYLDLADEMGLVVLAETGLFGSSLKLNFSEPVSWQRFAEHYDAMVRRDRNHPSVFGWSFGNELFAIFDYNQMNKADRDAGYAKLTELGRRSFKLDPTREWVSCDGDEDLRGTMPVWAKHFGHGLPLDRLPKLAKPLMVGESGGTYYARPAQLADFNGDRAYESYAGRNEALAIDAYQNIVEMARPRLAYFSASELAWFGLEHLPLGYRDFKRLPTQADGVFFRPFEEGQPGMQPERIASYSTTFNPGFDPALPLYKPLAMFEAMKAALAKDGPQPCSWDHKREPHPRPVASLPVSIVAVDFIGDRAGSLFTRLADFGMPFVADADVSNATMLVVDGETLTSALAEAARPRLERVLSRGGQVLICFRQPNADVALVNRLLPLPVSLTPREATALGRGGHPWSESFSLADLYFAENQLDAHVLKCGLDGAFVQQGVVALKASNTDWSQFNNMPEVAKCAAVVLYEQLQKPAGAALVEMKHGRGSIAVSTIDYQPSDRAYVALWQNLLRNMGVNLGAPQSVWQLPVAPVRAVTWHYTTNAPATGWEATAFDDSGWQTGEAGFGTDVPDGRPGTRWVSSNIWLRTKFDFKPGVAGDPKLVVYHDEDVEVFLNGKRVLSEGGFITKYKEFPLPKEIVARLKPTGNQVAVHCRQTAGGQYIDVGVAQGLIFLDGVGARGHDLLLNGPKD